MSASMAIRGRTLRRAALAVCLGLASVAPFQQPQGVARAADSSTWYWQNPLPRGYAITAIACRSVTACVAVGQGGSIVTTDDGGRTWTNRFSGTNIGLWTVTCPGQTVCYATGFTGYLSGPPSQVLHQVFLKSADGGKTWRQPAVHLPMAPHQFPSTLTCASVTTCVVGGWDNNPGESNPMLRTTDGGRTWQAVSVPGLQNLVFVTCATGTVCYALVAINVRERLLRSADGGKTWTARGLHAPTGLEAMACPRADTCFATASNCGGECDIGDIFLTTNGARRWKRVADQPTRNSLRGVVCPTAATCYVLGGRSVVRTTDGGKAWSIRRLPDPAQRYNAPAMACPSTLTCYVAAGFTVLKTSDGFGHTEEKLAHSVIHDLSLNDIGCPSTTSCYAAGTRNVDPGSGPGYDVAAPFVATSDGGKIWRATPRTPDVLARLSCLRPTVCYAIGESNGDSRELAVDRSDNGARTWLQTTWQQISPQLDPMGQAWDISCLAATTCYLLATISMSKGGTFGPPLVAVLVTHDDGRTWSVQTGIDGAARAAGMDGAVIPSRISCPSVTTCFVLATVFHDVTGTPASQPQDVKDVVVLSTTDGGESWTQHIPKRGAPPIALPPWMGQALACPTTTTCYLLSYTPNPETGNPNAFPGPVLVTHDAGATWRSSVVGPDAYLFSIACATAHACRVAGPDGIFGTDDGGTTWQRQLMADGEPAPGVASIACPAASTCYAVGEEAILAMHPPSRMAASSRNAVQEQSITPSPTPVPAA